VLIQVASAETAK